MVVNFRSIKGHIPVKAQRWHPGAAVPGVATNTKLVDGVYEVDGTGDVLGETIQSGDWLVLDFHGEWHVLPDEQFQKVFEELK
jgi:hypothetical protein